MKTSQQQSIKEYTSITDFVDECINEFGRPTTAFDVNKVCYYIIGEELDLSLNNQTRIPFEIRKCDYFRIESNTLNSWDNFPKRRYYIDEPDISITFDNTEQLDMSVLHIQYPELQELRLCYFDNFDLHNLQGMKINQLLHFRSVKPQNIYDLSQYTDIITDGLEFSENIYGFKNLPHILLCKHISRLYVNCCEIYHTTQIDILRGFIHKFLSQQNKEQYIMDMTLGLLNAGFENEV